MTAATDPLLDRVRALVERVAGPSRTPADSGPGTPLSGGGFWLDSVDLLEVVIACESELGVTFDAVQDLTGEAVATLGGLTELVRAKRERAREAR